MPTWKRHECTASLPYLLPPRYWNSLRQEVCQGVECTWFQEKGSWHVLKPPIQPFGSGFMRSFFIVLEMDDSSTFVGLLSYNLEKCPAGEGGKAGVSQSQSLACYIGLTGQLQFSTYSRGLKCPKILSCSQVSGFATFNSKMWWWKKKINLIEPHLSVIGIRSLGFASHFMNYRDVYI